MVTLNMHIDVPEKLDGHTAYLVGQFAEALAKKLFKAQEKYGYTNEWMDNSWMDKCREDMMIHIEKGDPIDVAAYCAFLFFHNQPTFTRKSVDVIN